MNPIFFPPLTVVLQALWNLTVSGTLAEHIGISFQRAAIGFGLAVVTAVPLGFLMGRYSEEQFINVGTGEDLTIRELAGMVAEAIGFAGTLATDPSKPDGTPRKLMDVSRLHALGWRHRIGLREGIAQTYASFRASSAPG